MDLNTVLLQSALSETKEMKQKKQYVCANCGSIHHKWIGQCFECGTWGSVTEEVINLSKIKPSIDIQYKILESLAPITSESERVVTPIQELNKVLGGGLVPASAILIGGDPGIGKSTLLLQLTSSLASIGKCCLYVTGEESVEQIKLRAHRLGVTYCKNLLVLGATSIEQIITSINANESPINLLVIDSIQTMASDLVQSAPGTVSQVRSASHELISYCKHKNIVLIMACHVTKDGQLAGPKLLEHMVDTVLYFEGDYHNHFRILRTIKNRFGNVGEIGVFEMASTGLLEVTNPSSVFLMDRERNVSGSAIFPGIEGSRTILVEIQALITDSYIPTPRRSVVGWDLNRLSMIIAILNLRYGLNLSSKEVYLSVAGGLKISEPAADLAVATALISSATNKILPKKSVFFGEISLSGEIRKVNNQDSRIKEAKKLGFDSIFCPNLSKSELQQVVTQVTHISQFKSLI